MSNTFHAHLKQQWTLQKTPIRWWSSWYKWCYQSVCPVGKRPSRFFFVLPCHYFIYDTFLSLHLFMADGEVGELVFGDSCGMGGWLMFFGVAWILVGWLDVVLGEVGGKCWEGGVIDLGPLLIQIQIQIKTLFRATINTYKIRLTKSTIHITVRYFT